MRRRIDLDPDRQAVVVETEPLIGAEERQADAVDEDVARERQRILRHGRDRACRRSERAECAADGDRFVELRIAVDADHADAADEFAVADDSIRHAARAEDAVERDAAGFDGAVVDGCGYGPSSGNCLPVTMPGPQPDVPTERVARSAVERLRRRNGLGRIERCEGRSRGSCSRCRTAPRSAR